jgi:hypothetical protein
MLLHTEAFTHRSFDAQMLFYTHTLALFLSRPRSATTPKAHIKCLYAPNGFGRRACRRQLNKICMVYAIGFWPHDHPDLSDMPTYTTISHTMSHPSHKMLGWTKRLRTAAETVAETVANINATSSEHTLNPQTPRVKRVPLLRIRETVGIEKKTIRHHKPSQL